jgi:outer membrane protein assembly factor BamB
MKFLARLFGNKAHVTPNDADREQQPTQEHAAPPHAGSDGSADTQCPSPRATLARPKAPTIVFSFETEKVKTDGRVMDPPVAESGRVYFGCEDRHLYSIDGLTGSLLWKVKGDESFTAPILDRNSVYSWCWDGYIYAIRKDTGALMWKTEASGGLKTRVAQDENSILFVSAGTLQIIDKKTGRVGASFRTDESDGTEVFVHENTAYFAVNESRQYGHLYAVDCRTGTLKWKAKHVVDPLFDERPTVSNGMVYVPYTYPPHSHGVFAYDAATGTKAWEFEPDGEIYSPVLAVGESVLFGGRCSKLFALASRTGAVEWSMDASVFTPLRLEGDTLYFGDAWDSIHAVNIVTRQSSWEYNASSHPFPFALLDGVIYFGCQANRLQALACP